MCSVMKPEDEIHVCIGSYFRQLVYLAQNYFHSALQGFRGNLPQPFLGILGIEPWDLLHTKYGHCSP